MGYAPLGGSCPTGACGGAERTSREYSSAALEVRAGPSGSPVIGRGPTGRPAPSDRSEPPSSPASVAPVDHSDRQARIILVLSAERDAASIIAAPLTGLGHKVVATPYGPTALDLAHEARIIVVDNTPGVSSTDIVGSIKSRADLTAMPLLAIARSDTVEERIELLEAGADDVM